MTNTNKPTIGVVCSTYRNPDKPSLTRLYGIASLIDQIRNQDFEADVTTVIVDDSAQPHPFIEGLNGGLKDELIYLHVPERNNVPDSIKTRYPNAARFFPTDDELANDKFWQSQLLKVAAWQNFLPFDYEFAKTHKIDMVGQIKAERPTIGMKKNFGCQAFIDATGKVPDVFVYVDDDDLRSPDYLKTVVEGIKGHSFARVMKTYAHNVSPDPAHRVWSEIDFKVKQDINGSWYLPDEVMNSDCYGYKNGEVVSRPTHDLFQRNLLLAWPIIGQDGALHNYTGETWMQAVDAFGGFFPTSFSEDIITNKMMHNLPGFSAAKIEVDTPPFIRCSDGRNASDFWASKIIDPQEVAPWAQQAVKLLYAATDSGLSYEQHEKALHSMGATYARRKALDHSVLDKPDPDKPQQGPKNQGPTL